MKKIVMACMGVVLSAAVQAGVPVLGFEIGVSTAQQVRAKIAGQTKQESQGINQYSGGEQFKTDGAGYGIDGLTEVTYIFDEKDKLSAVLMTLSKNRFDELFNVLARKYKVQKQDRPFVGDQFGRFKTSDATIELDAPHMSFSMSANYIRDDLLKAFKAKSAEDARKKKADESAKF